VFSQQQSTIAFPAGLLNATICPVIVTDSAITDAADETAMLDRIQNKTEQVSALGGIFIHYVTEDNLSIEMIAGMQVYQHLHSNAC
jgi:hypothetical protein